MTLIEKAKQDNRLMNALKIKEIRHILAATDRGALCLTLKEGGSFNDYRFTLDAIPFDDKDNQQLMNFYEGTLYTK